MTRTIKALIAFNFCTLLCSAWALGYNRGFDDAYKLAERYGLHTEPLILCQNRDQAIRIFNDCISFTRYGVVHTHTLSVEARP